MAWFMGAKMDKFFNDFDNFLGGSTRSPTPIAAVPSGHEEL
jgi:farnesyl-diphosphate farnesyltransferase